MLGFEIDPDIRRAHTPPARFYTDHLIFDTLKRTAFAQSWQLVADADAVKAPGNVYPCAFLEGAIDEPLLLTRVSFISYVWKPHHLDRSGAGAGLDRVEREDEAIVEATHRGLKSGFYTRGRYSPARETGPHHFHRLCTASLNDKE